MRARMCVLLALFLWISSGPQWTWASGGKQIVLGVATTLDLIEGNESLKAVELAVSEINRRGGVSLGGQRHALRVESTDLRDAIQETSVQGALSALERLIVEKNVAAVLVGPFRSEVLLPAMDIVAKHRTPLLGTIAMSPATEIKVMRNPEYRYIFRTCLNSRYLVACLIDAMKLLNDRFGLRRVFIMNQDVAWARTTVSLMMKLYFKRAGWQVVGMETFAGGSSDYAAGLRRAREQGAQVILPIFDMPESGNLVDQWKLMGVPALLCGFISPMIGPAAWQNSGGKVAGAVGVCFELGNVPSTRYAPSVAFHHSYRRVYGREIEAGHGPAPAYDSVYILSDAMERAGSLDPEKIVPALEDTDWAGAMGRIKFQRGHQVVFGREPGAEALACLFQWTANGRRRIVYPPSIAEGEIELPGALAGRSGVEPGD